MMEYFTSNRSEWPCLPLDDLIMQIYIQKMKMEFPLNKGGHLTGLQNDQPQTIVFVEAGDC